MIRVLPPTLSDDVVQYQIAAEGGADRRSAKIAQADESIARSAPCGAPLHSPRGASAAVFAVDWPHEGD